MRARPLPPGDRILNVLPIGICVLRPDFTVKFWNAFLRDMTGILPKQIINCQISDFFPNFKDPKYTLRITSIFSGGAPIVFSSQLHPHILPSASSDIKERVWHTTVSSLKIPGGGGCYALLAFRDVTDLTEQISAWRDMRNKAEDEIIVRKAIEEELNLKAEQLEQVNQYKSEFLANTSHELRTPLNSMLILSSELCRNDTDNLTDDQLRSLQIIHKGGRDLLGLINDLLDLSKIEAGKMTIHQTSVQLQRLLDDMQATFAAETEKKHLEFRVIFDETVPATIISDLQRLTQIIRNLISNSLKFTSTGSITLHIHPVDADTPFTNPDLNASTSIGLSVTDTGMGIAEDKLQDVFQAFRQADGAISRQFGGTGLGLAISRKLAGLLGGELHVVSQLHHGTTFTLYLPLEASPGYSRDDTPQAVQPQVAPALPAATIREDVAQLLRGKHVLLVDDDMRSLFTLSRQLTTAGATVWKACNTDEAFTHLDSHKPDLIVMDIQLPGLDDFEAIRKIREFPGSTDIPIVIFSAQTQERERAVELAHGAVAYLAKPLDQNDLMQALKQAFE